MTINRWLFTGIIVIIYAIGSMLYTIYYRKTAIILKGVVVHNICNKGEYTPVVKVTYQGKQQSIECNETSKFRKYLEDEEIQVYYKPNSKKVYIVGNDSSFVVNLLIIGVGILLIVMGLNR